MIRKPDARDFRESTAVTAIRDARSLTVEGAKGVGQGARGLVKWWLIITGGFGFTMSALAAGPGGMLILALIGVPVFLWWNNKRHRRAAHDHALKWGEPTARPEMPWAAPMAPVSHELTAGAAGRAAAKIAAPAVLLFPTTALLEYMLPFMLTGIVMLALAFLIVARLFGDRTLLTYDAEQVTAKGLLGEATILWADVVDVSVRRAPWWDLRVIFTSGGRRNLLILGRFNRLGGPDTLYVPIDLLGLDTPALTKLVTGLLMLRAGAPIAALDKPVDTPATVAPPRLIDQASFDPDAIMARYLADKEALKAQQRPDLTPGATARPTFGRKRAA